LHECAVWETSQLFYTLMPPFLTTSKDIRFANQCRLLQRSSVQFLFDCHLYVLGAKCLYRYQSFAIAGPSLPLPIASPQKLPCWWYFVRNQGVQEKTGF